MVLILGIGSLHLDKIQNQFDNDTLFIWGHALDPEKITGNKADIKAFQNYLQSLLALCCYRNESRKNKRRNIKSHEYPRSSRMDREKE
jgi:cyclase